MGKLQKEKQDSLHFAMLEYLRDRYPLTTRRSQRMRQSYERLNQSTIELWKGVGEWVKKV